MALLMATERALDGWSADDWLGLVATVVCTSAALMLLFPRRRKGK